jgi:hypothetical protein
VSPAGPLPRGDVTRQLRGRSRRRVRPARRQHASHRTRSAHPLDNGGPHGCRDGSGAYTEAARRAVPGAAQGGDRWHLQHGLAGAVLKEEVAAHASYWAAAGPPVKEGKRAETTAERWREVHDLLGKGTGLLECSRRLGLSLNTVKRHARAGEPERLVRAPQYRPALAGPYRDHLRARRAEDPAVPVLRLLAEIRELGYTGSINQLYRYITQGGVESGRLHLSSRRRPAPAHPASRAQQPPAGADRQADRRLPRDDQPRRPYPVLRRLAQARSRKRRQAPRTDPCRIGRGPARRPRLHPGPAPRHGGRHRSRHPAVP